MSSAAKPEPLPFGPRAHRVTIAVAIGLFALLGLGFLAAPVTREVGRTTAPHEETDVERFGGTRDLLQTFLAPDDRLTEIHVALRPPLPPDVFPLFFHLRHGRYAPRDIRTVVLTASDVGPDGVLRARFLPVPKSGGRPYAFVLSAPNAQTGALTAYRQIDGAIYEQGSLFSQHAVERHLQGDRPGDLEFALFARRPRIAFLWEAYRRPRLALAERPEPGPSLLPAVVVGVIATAGLVAVLVRLRRPSPRPKLSTVLVVLMVAHIFLHAPFLVPYPGVNDEGSYLMDIQNIRAGVWPFRDTLAKGPLFLVLLAPVALAFPPTLLPARLLVTVVSSIEIPLLYALGRALGGRAVGLLAASFWALAPVAVAHTSQLFLQPFSIPLVTGALLLLVRSPQRRLFFPPGVWAGILLALAYLTRASSLAFVAPSLLLCLVGPGTLRARARQAALLVLGMGATLGPIALAVLPILGPIRTAVMFNLEAFLIGHARGGGGPSAAFTILPPSEITERFVAYGAVLFRTGTALVLPWVAVTALLLVRILRLPLALAGALFLGSLLPLLQRVYAANFFLAEASTSRGPDLKLLTALLVLLLGLVLWVPRLRPLDEPRRALRQGVVVGAGFLALVIMYAFFGRFREQYHAEFLPFYILGSALAIAPLLPGGERVPLPRVRSLFRSLVGRAPHAVGLSLLVLIAASLFLSFAPSRRQPHTGSIPHRTALEVARVLQAHSAPREEILTAQGLFTFYADRFLPFGASHPGWYLEERAGTVPPDLRRLFLPDKADLRRYVEEKPVRLVAIDRRTREVYFSYDPEMQALLTEQFRLLTSVPNPFEERPVEIWIRKSAK